MLTQTPTLPPNPFGLSACLVKPRLQDMSILLLALALLGTLGNAVADDVSPASLATKKTEADGNAGEGLNTERAAEPGPTEGTMEEEEIPPEISPLPGTEIFPDGLIQLCMSVQPPHADNHPIHNCTLITTDNESPPPRP
jgi:hypothetical protein